MESSEDVKQIPGVGEKIANKFKKLGIVSVQDLKTEKPQDLYERLQILERAPVDPCVLYVFRLAVYFARNHSHDPELLKWWNWKDKPLE